MKQIYSTLLVATLTFTACGGGGGSTPSTNKNPSLDNTLSSQQTLAQIHKYTIEAVPTSGGNCKGATGEMIINGSDISGTITTGWGDVLTIGGTYVSRNGNVSGGFAKNNLRLAEYSGTIVNNNATGRWSDSLGCSGTWKGVGNASNYVTTPVSNIVSSDGKTFDPYNLQGYTISYNQLGLDYYNIKIACDSSYVVTLTRRGLMSEVDHGDVINISEDELGFGSLNKFSLIDGNLVVGESKNLVFGDKVSSVAKYQECH